jgi:hypothetical protein
MRKVHFWNFRKYVVHRGSFVDCAEGVSDIGKRSEGNSAENAGLSCS